MTGTGLFITSFAVLTVVFIVFAIKLIRKNMITQTDTLGVSVKSGKHYLWNDLIKIEYFVRKYALREERILSINFFFKDGGIASAGYLMPNFSDMLKLADKFQVPKSKKAAR